MIACTRLGRRWKSGGVLLFVLLVISGSYCAEEASDKSIIQALNYIALALETYQDDPEKVMKSIDGYFESHVHEIKAAIRQFNEQKAKWKPSVREEKIRAFLKRVQPSIHKIYQLLEANTTLRTYLEDHAFDPIPQDIQDSLSYPELTP
jgi:hypothetical protein